MVLVGGVDDAYWYILLEGGWSDMGGGGWESLASISGSVAHRKGHHSLLATTSTTWQQKSARQIWFSVAENTNVRRFFYTQCKLSVPCPLSFVLWNKRASMKKHNSLAAPPHPTPRLAINWTFSRCFPQTTSPALRLRLDLKDQCSNGSKGGHCKSFEVWTWKMPLILVEVKNWRRLWKLLTRVKVHVEVLKPQSIMDWCIFSRQTFWHLSITQKLSAFIVQHILVLSVQHILVLIAHCKNQK